MTEYLTSEKYAEALKKYKGADAKLWLFSRSRNRLVIRLHFEDKQEDLFIVCVACYQIRGSFVWDNANISIVNDNISNDPYDAFTRVIDREEGFELVCNGGIAMVISSDDILWDHFDT